AYNNRAVAYYKKGDIDRAINDCTEAIRVDPNLVLAYLNRGAAYLKKGDKAKAKADFDEAKKLGYKPT
ncbi:MAG: tetratricopeptide repeat protein, partial [Thermoguttaceae bacterium]